MSLWASCLFDVSDDGGVILDEVFSDGDCFEVIGSHASLVSASVMDSESWTDGSDKKLVGISVCPSLMGRIDCGESSVAGSVM